MATPRNLRAPSRPSLPLHPSRPTQAQRATEDGRAAQIVQSATDAILSTDRGARIDTWNRAAEELFGYSAAEAVGRPVSIIVPAGRVLEHRRLFACVMAGERIHQYETLRQRKDGATVNVSLTLFGLRDATGAVVAAASIVRDISEQRRAEARQREIETFVARVTTNMNEGLLTLDPNGRIASINPAGKQLLGYEDADLLGRTMCSALGWQPAGEQGSANTESELAKIVSGSAAVRLRDTLFTRKDGTRLPIALSTAPLGEGEGGRVGKVIVFQDASDRNAASERAHRELEEMSWIGRLRDAMDEGRLELAAQPIVSLLSGEVGRHELLLRLRDRSGRLVAPGEFLPAAERFDLIRELDRWVLAQGARLAAEGHAVNVNLSARSLGDPELGATIERALRQAGAEPSLITFEITETALTGHPELACKFAQDIAALGCQFALDDFGTGYGAFTYLKQLPIHYLKIDREFVHDVAENAASRHVVQALISLARGFGQQTIAEGVESQETLELLRELGVDHVQGFHVGPPAPLCDMAARTSR